MQELAQALEEAKDLHQTVLGWPAPALGPQSYLPFPAGVDPIQHALAEVQHLKELSQQASFAPRQDAWTPPVDCSTTEDDFVVQLDVPGVPHEDLKVFIVGGECVVRGERKPPDIVATRRMVSEHRWGAFERRFVVPAGGRIDEMQARATDGVLELRIPLEKVEGPKEKRVVVTATPKAKGVER